MKYTVEQNDKQIERIKANPWLRSLYGARSRCNTPSNTSYAKYGGNGIRCFLTLEQTRELWERDGGANMKRPSLDRIDSKKDYTFENCRFIELSENSRLGIVTYWDKIRENGGPAIKLTETDVIEIRRTYQYGQASKLAEKFGVDKSTILQIVRGEIWKHVAATPPGAGR